MAAKKDKKLKITLVKSTIGAIPKHRNTVKSMGFHKLGSSVVLPDNDATKGQIAQIRHLVKVEEVDA
ncbi:MAG: 50S ribosomal protein L30 [Lachnospiraceae bacterium]|nr:50S ribosomal protein L30 [Lachnospiraceae bacterium]